MAERLAVVGMSNTPTCGARDHATLLAGELERGGVSCSMHWLNRRREHSLRASHIEIRNWGRELAAELERERPDAMLLHYSAFAFAHRGVPLSVPSLLSSLRRSGVPLVTLLHEYAYPWHAGDLRGNVWATTQRAVLFELVHASCALVLTTDFRAEELASARWLPTRPVVSAPVFSNLPAPSVAPRPDAAGEPPLVGLFGYSYEGTATSLVLGAIGQLLDRGTEVRLRLLGAPGQDSAAGQDWLAQARERGIEHALSFSGSLPAQELSDALAACELLLFADPPGPTSRKGTLAGSLASGRPVIATDGPRTWAELVRADAARVVEPTPDALAEAIASMLADEAGREALGARGRVFAEREMGLARSAELVTWLVREIDGERIPA